MVFGQVGPSIAVEGEDRSKERKETAKTATSALQLARSQGAPVLVEEETTQVALTYANPDGSFTQEISATPERVFVDGKWSDLDSRLKLEDDVLAPIVAGNTVEIAETIEKGEEVATVSTNKRVLSSASKQLAGKEVSGENVVGEGKPGSSPTLSLVWPKALSDPEVEGDSATFADAHELGDLTISASATSFSPTLVIRKRPKTWDQTNVDAGSGERKKSGVLAAKSVKIRMPFVTKGLKLAEAKGLSGALEIHDMKDQVVGSFSAPLAISEEVDPESSEPLSSTPVDMKLTGSEEKPVVELSVPSQMFSDVSAQSPVVLRMDTTLSDNGATFVQKGSTTSGGSMAGMNFNSDNELKAGTYDSGSHIARSYIRFPIASLSDTGVTSARVRLWENWSASCTARPLDVKRVKDPWSVSTVTWNNMPTIQGDAVGTVNKSMGWSSSCKEGYLPNDQGIAITQLVRDWVSGAQPVRGLALVASASDSLGWKRFWSDNVTNTSKRPHLLVTYFRKPNTPAKPTIAPASAIINTKTPTVSTTVSSPDGTSAGKITTKFTLKNTVTGATWTGTAPAVNSGSKASLQIPAAQIAEGGKYTVTATASVTPASGVTLTSGSSAASNQFTVDTVKPVTPLVSASSYTDGGTFDPAPESNVFTFSPGSSTDVVKYEYSQDGGPNKSVTASGGTATLNWAPKIGLHTLKVWAFDAAGNKSDPPRTFSFTVGSVGFTAPGIQARSSRIFPVGATMPGQANKATVSWSVDGTTFHPITAGLFIQHDGSVDQAWDGTGLVSAAGSAALPEGLIWDIDKTKEADSFADENLEAPNIVRLRVCFQQNSDPALCTSGDGDVPVQYVHHAFGGNFAEADIQGGTVALQTGELKVEEADAVLPGSSDISVGRSWLSLEGDIDDADAIFGPGWVPSVPAPGSGAGDATVVDRSSTGSIMLNYPTGDTDVFVHKTKNGTGNGSYIGSGLTAESGSTLTLAANSLELTDTDGTTTTWTKQGAEWVDPVIKETASQGRHRIISSPTTRTAVTGRYLDGGTPTWCASLPTSPSLEALTKRGCKVMTVNITPENAAAPTGNDVGAFPRRANDVTVTLWDPATEAMATTVVSQYEYDAAGLLVGAWDPRLDGSYGSMKAKYAYDKVGVDHRLIQATPESAMADGQPALTPVTYGYDGIKRTTVSRRHDPVLDQDASIFVVYGVPLHNEGILPDLRAETVTSWNQHIDGAPGSAVAVFTPDPHHDLPNNTDVYTPGDEDWQYGSITYMNELGAPTNSAVMGGGQWLVDTTQYNEEGEVTSTLAAPHRALALAEDCTAAPGVCSQSSSAEKAALLQSDTIYDPANPGVVTDTYSPAVESQLPDGTMATTRLHAKTLYNQGAPAGFEDDNPGTMLPTTETTKTLVVDGPGAGAEVDPRVTTTTYDNSPAGGTSGWTLRVPTQTSSDTGTGQTIRQRTAYDAEGTITKTLQPSSNGNDAGTTLKFTYSAASNSEAPNCGGKPEWEDLPCSSKLAAQPAGAGLPGSYVASYDKWLNPLVAKDVSPSGADLRTTTNTYDTAGRVMTSKTDSTVTGDIDIPVTTTTYSPTIGSVIKVSSTAGDLTTGYDSWGRTVMTTDATGNTATTQFNIASSPASVNDGQGSIEYTYDYGSDNQERGEHRGVVTTVNTNIDDDTDGLLHASYGIEGSPTHLVYPNGVEANQSFDAAGQLRSKEYVTGQDETIASWSQVWTPYGQVAEENSDGRTQVYGYDKISRLLKNTDTRSDSCQSRAYGFDVNSNRLSKSDSTPNSGDCVAGVSTSRTGSYNAADQQTSSTVETTVDGNTQSATGSYVYDALGRTTVLPAVDSPNGVATEFTYFADDQVASQKQGSTVMSWTRDPEERAVSWSTAGGGGTAAPNGTNHYAGEGDSPAWTSYGTTITRFFGGIDGGLALTSVDEGSDAGTTLSIVNPHGDIAATIKNVPDAGLGDVESENETDEYGNSLSGSAPTTYGWEGGAQRSRNTLSGLTLMGVRQYNPATGRFLSVDPVEGGNANTYTYPVDPVNGEDLDGRYAGSRWDKMACVQIGFLCAQAYSVTNYVNNLLGRGRDDNLSWGRKRNAARHFVWNFMLMTYIGLARTRIVTEYHEFGSSGVEKAIDLHNNRLTQRTQYKNARAARVFIFRRDLVYKTAMFHFKKAWSSKKHRASFACKSKRGRKVRC